MQYNRFLGGGDTDWPMDIQQTPDSGYIVCGWIRSNDGDVTCMNASYGGWLVKLNRAFDIQWQKCFSYNTIITLNCILVTADKGFLIGAEYVWTPFSIGPCSNPVQDDGNFLLIKTDSLGNVQWEKCLGGGGRDVPYDIKHTSDGGYIVTGTTNSVDGDLAGRPGCNECNDDIWVVKLDSAGNIQWSKSFGGIYSEGTYGGIIESNEREYYVCGSATHDNGIVIGTHGGFDWWVIKIDSLGSLIWQKALGGSSDDAAGTLALGPDGGVIVMGEASSTDGDVTGNHGSWDTWVVRLDSNGNIIWKKCFGGSGYDSGRSMTKTLDGNYMLLSSSSSQDGDVSGNQGSDFWFTKIDSSGNILTEYCFGGFGPDRPESICATTDMGYAAIGMSGRSNRPCTNGGTSCDDFWVLKIRESTVSVPEISIDELINIFPNPATDHITVHDLKLNDEIKVFGITANLVMQITASHTQEKISLSDITPGMYLIEVGGARRAKFVKN